MKLTNLGGATAILEHDGQRMLFDPWLDDGIFHGAWYRFPPLAVKLEDLGRFDYIYISHIHEDHCSAGTIRHLNRDAEIILMDRHPNLVARFLESYDFRFKKIHLIKPRTEIHLAQGLSVNVLEADPANQMSYAIDSALLLRWDGFTVYNANDCQPYEEGLRYIAENYASLDLALIPYAGGSGYPSCYTNLTASEKLAEKHRILQSRIEAFVYAVRRINPKYVMPFADQYVVAGSRSDLNCYISHPACPGLVRDSLSKTDFADRLLLLNSGQSFDFDHGIKTPNGDYRPYTEEDREKYVAANLLDKRYDHEKISLSRSVSLDRLIAHARSRLWEMQQKTGYLSEFSLYLEMPESARRFQIRFDRKDSREVDVALPMEPPYLKISCDHTLVILLLIGAVSWNIADAALFLDYERVPNVYDPDVYVYLNYLKV